MGWSSLRIAGGALDIDWQSLWTTAYADASLCFRDAIFRRFVATGGSILYFSPGARAIGEALGAKSCDRPVAEGLHMVVGDDWAWKAHFPEHRYKA